MKQFVSLIVFAFGASFLAPSPAETTPQVPQAAAKKKAKARKAKCKKLKTRPKTGIKWVVSPGEVEVYLDGKKNCALAGELKFSATRPGTRKIRLVRGGDEAEMDVRIVRGQVLRVEYEFSD